MPLDPPQDDETPLRPELNPLRRQLLRINPDVLVLLGKRSGIATDGAPYPPDARVVGRMIDERGDLVLIVESAEFAEVPEGSVPPEMRGLVFRMPTTRPRLLNSRRHEQAEAQKVDQGGA